MIRIGRKNSKIIINFKNKNINNKKLNKGYFLHNQQLKKISFLIFIFRILSRTDLRI